jgi:hypothetical protein
MVGSTSSVHQRLRLKDTHPVAKKVEKLYQLADELGISFHFGYVCHLEVRGDDVEYIFEDLEADSGSDEGNPRCFPPSLEWKITKENPKYTEQEQKANEAARKAEAKRQREVEAKRKAAEAAKRKAEQERIKKADLKELARLKRKYEK